MFVITSDEDVSTDLQGLASLSKAGSKNVTCRPGQLMEGDDTLLPQPGDGACQCCPPPLWGVPGPAPLHKGRSSCCLQEV